MPSSPSSTAPIQQKSHVVQAIVDSVTRCFHPIQVYPCSDNSSGNPTNANQTVSPPMTNADADNNAQNHSTSSPSSSPKRKQYDADRYIHRKLEIFRTTDEDCIAAFGIPRPRPSSSTRHALRRSTSQSKVQSRGGGGGGGNSNRKSNTLVSSSDEEITNLAKNQKRFDEEGYDHKKDQSGTFIASLFRIVQDPLSCIVNADKHYNYSGGGLCFASPVRMAETENVSELSDWRLTANEFVAKYQGGRAIDGRGKNNTIANTADDDIPDVVASSASEEATMTSASYFDQKYSHIIEKNPPVPLFREYLVDVSENNTNGVMKIFEMRKAGAGGTPTRGGVGSWRRNNESPQSSKSSQTPVHIKVKKKSPKISSHAKSHNYDSAPIGKSSSVSTQSADDEKTPSPSTSTRSLWQRMCNTIVPDQQQHQPEPHKNYREPEFVISL